MVRSIELLVHAGAPSRRQDDERYRAQANAYRGFRGTILEHGDPTSRQLNGDSSEPALPAAALMVMQPDLVTSGKYDATTFLDDTQLAWSALDSQLIASSLILRAPEPNRAPLEPRRSDEHLRSQPRVVHMGGSFQQDDHKQKLVTRPQVSETAKRAHSPIAGSSRSRLLDWRTGKSHDTPSTPSSYLKSPDLNRSAKRSRTNDTHQLPTGVSLLPVGYNEGVKSTTLAADGQPPPPIDAHCSQTPTVHNESTSELPTSYSLSDITSGSSRIRPNISQRSSSDPGPQAAPLHIVAPDAAHNASHAKSFDQNVSSGAPAVTTKADETITNDANNPTEVYGHEECQCVQHPAESTLLQAKHNKRHAQGSITASPLAALSMTIQPPVPPVSLDTYTTNVTPDLKSLVEDAVLRDCFRPAVVTTLREIRPLERGYWLVKCPETSQKWDVERQLKFWNFLEKYVGSGRAGWGVWCIREPSTDKMASLGIVKVYCWGETMKHLYYLLYVASSSQVRKMGLQWIDGGEEVVVQMRST